MCSGLIHRIFVGILLKYSFLLLASAAREANQEMEIWAFYKEWDKLNGLNFILTRSPMPKRELYKNIRSEIIC